MGLMPFSEARARALARVSPIKGKKKIHITKALGRILAEPVMAPANVPNHDNTAMDGYAVRFQDLSSTGDSRFRVTETVQAGNHRTAPLNQGEAVRILTGAPVPPGCDCIVIQENATRDGDMLTVPMGEVQNRWIRRAGQDIAQGSEVFAKGHRLTPPDIGMLASLGYAKVTVMRRLRVAIISTGNEVCAPGNPLAPGQIYDSNRHSMIGALQALGMLGVKIIDLGIVRDDRASIKAALLDGADRADVVLSSGGVSEGDYDLIKEIIAEIGQIDFWKVRMKPGKPQAHGRIGNAEFFGLPGNPVSVLATYLLLVRPALLVMMGGVAEPQKTLTLPYRGAPIVKTHDRMEFARGIIAHTGENAHVTSAGSQNSGVLTSMARANAFIMLGEAPCTLREGDLATVIAIEY